MKKKKTSSIAAAATTTTDLKTLIRSHSAFFDHLVSLVPPKFYISGADDDDRPYFNGLSKAAKASFRKQSRENTKKSRRDRFNPETPSSTLDLLHQSLENPNPKKPETPPNPSSGSVTYEELRARLRQRIEDLRSGRNTRPKPHDTHKRKREEEEEVEEQLREEVKEEKEEKLDLKDLSYGKIKLGEKKNKKKKLSKAQALEKAKRLEELKKDPEKGEVVAKKLSWKTAASRAAGEKVHDDPKLIKESIKKEKKRQQKHAEKWKERVDSRETARKEKQKTRTDNIKERIQQKKARRIEKREKKLMRPGFEGRKEGYINH
ncbi:surfeit locus protein 6-like [Iris pallida]|uniref:Surfeit locus protein 6-like n=1 Tax=Iris pallida TaxID=29817 RepID=A0AAX6E660_IRIPA|nr:surfeit locus protein 6-like [Iris pallida]KAJ6818002.1 surfeit locus protein 6-like [Iris pallida]